MAKYESYKDSGVDWLGQLPNSWETIRMKFLFKDTSIKNKAKETLLSVTQNQGVVPREWVENRMVMPSGNLESFKFIEKGDFAISLRSFEGGLEYCHHDGIISPAYIVLKTKRADLIEGYYKYLFKSQAFISELQTSVVGIREGKNISYEELQYSLLPIPSEQEQTAIANFLDNKTAQIDEAIAIKEKQIELLKERKQLIIQQAVTQGLNSDAPMKDSGVDWIGEIPEHWDEVTKIKYISSLKGRQGWQGLKAEEYTDEGPHVLSSAHFNNYIIHWDKCPRVSYERYLMDTNIQLQIGDILLMKDGANMGKLAFVSDLPGPACLNSHLLLFRSLKDKNSGKTYFNSKYMFFHMMCSEFKDYVKINGTGATFLGISQESIGNYQLCLPPMSEQEKIVSYLEQESLRYEEAIHQQETQIEKLKEYKTTLINSSVTGKIKVPEVASEIS